MYADNYTSEDSQKYQMRVDGCMGKPQVWLCLILICGLDQNLVCVQQPTTRVQYCFSIATWGPISDFQLTCTEKRRSKCA